VSRVVLANPKAIKSATQTAKTDKLDARTLAKLLAAGFLPQVWTPDERTRTLRRRISRRAQLVRQRIREKHEVHAILIRNLSRCSRSPSSTAEPPVRSAPPSLFLVRKLTVKGDPPRQLNVLLRRGSRASPLRQCV
jgi:transposase/antidote-toxin recognition MazE-like antitoxin